MSEYYIKLDHINSFGKATGILCKGDEHICYFYELYDDEKDSADEVYRMYLRAPSFDSIEDASELITSLLKTHKTKVLVDLYV